MEVVWTAQQQSTQQRLEGEMKKRRRQREQGNPEIEQRKYDENRRLRHKTYKDIQGLRQRRYKEMQTYNIN